MNMEKVKKGGVLGILMFLGTTGGVYAAPVLEISDTMSGSEFKSYSFNIGATGDYKATLSDFGFPDAFDYLGLAISKGSTLLGKITNPGSFTFSASNAGMYTALVFGDTASPYNFGSFGLSVSPVPEPEAWALLLLGAGLMGYQLRRQSKKVSSLGLSPYQYA